MEKHRACLEFLCRICGSQVSKKKPAHRPWAKDKERFVVAAYTKEILESLFIVVNNDDPDIHPPNFCHNCYCRLKHSSATPLTTYSAWTPKNDWKPHDENGPCETCGTCRRLKRGGRPRKVRTGGRPRAAEYTSQKHFAKLTSYFNKDKVWEKSSLDLEYFSVKNAEMFLICSLCQDVLMRPVETRCRHLFCLECLSSQFEGEINEIQCPTCNEHIMFIDISAPPSYILPLINELEVACKHCKLTMPHARSLTHACAIPEKFDHTYASKCSVRSIAVNTTEKWPEPKQEKEERYFIYRHKIPCVHANGAPGTAAQHTSVENTGSQNTQAQNNVLNAGVHNARTPDKTVVLGLNTRPQSPRVQNSGVGNTPAQHSGMEIPSIQSTLGSPLFQH